MWANEIISNLYFTPDKFLDTFSKIVFFSGRKTDSSRAALFLIQEITIAIKNSTDTLDRNILSSSIS